MKKPDRDDRALELLSLKLEKFVRLTRCSIAAINRLKATSRDRPSEALARKSQWGLKSRSRQALTTERSPQN